MNDTFESRKHIKDMNRSDVDEELLVYEEALLDDAAPGKETKSSIDAAISKARNSESLPEMLAVLSDVRNQMDKFWGVE